MTNNSKNEKPQISETVFSIIVKVGILFGLFYLCNTFNLPIGLIGSIFLLVFSVYFTITKFNDLDKPKRVAFIGLIVSSVILTTLFSYKHYVSDIRITVLHIGVIILIPLLLWKHLEKKAKNE